MSTYHLQCASSPVGVAPSDMKATWMTDHGCTWFQSTAFPPTMSLSEGFAITGSIVAVWCVGFMIKAIKQSIKD